MNKLFDPPDESYRVERKFYISLEEAAALRERLSRVMQRDPHSDENGRYTISSVYFDDLDDHSLLSSALGLQKRKKYRIRAYNHSDDFISLECKQKNGVLSRKTQIRITRDEAEAFFRGDPSPFEGRQEELAKHFYFDMRTGIYRPRGIVEYDREIYLHPIEIVRITFDMRLRGSLGNCDLFSPPPMLPILPPEIVLLEVKYRHFLPDFIACLLPKNAMPATANCKYARSRAIQ